MIGDPISRNGVAKVEASCEGKQQSAFREAIARPRHDLLICAKYLSFRARAHVLS
jgi:hypothetical protein